MFTNVCRQCRLGKQQHSIHSQVTAVTHAQQSHLSNSIMAVTVKQQHIGMHSSHSQATAQPYRWGRRQRRALTKKVPNLRKQQEQEQICESPCPPHHWPCTGLGYELRASTEGQTEGSNARDAEKLAWPWVHLTVPSSFGTADRIALGAASFSLKASMGCLKARKGSRRGRAASR